MRTAKLSDEHIAGIKRYFPDRADALISECDFDIIIGELDSLSVDLLDDNYDATDESVAVCKLMDSIVWENSKH